MTHITCRLTAKNRDQLQNPTLGNRVWATFTFFYAMLTWTQMDFCHFFFTQPNPTHHTNTWGPAHFTAKQLEHLSLILV